MRLTRPAHPIDGSGRWLLAALLVLLCLPLGACKQTQGERCQVDRDCEEGYICCVRQADRALGGTCQPENACELTPISDGGQDRGAADRGVDATAADRGADRATDSAARDSGADARRDSAADRGTPDSARPDTSVDGLTADLAADVSTAE